MLPQVFNLAPHVHDLSESTFVFHYPNLAFIEAYSHKLIYTLTYLAAFGAILLASGVFPKIGAFLFFISFGYLFLIDMSFYNNHYYLWCLISFLYIIIDTNKSISIIDLIKKNTNKTISIGNYLVFGLLFSIVYFYGGIAKINSDWLQGYPMRLLTTNRAYPFPDILGIFMSYFGLFFDLLIPFILWYKPKSIFVVIPYFTFHLSNYFIFNIGEFPLVMIVAWAIYLTIYKYNIKSIFKDFGIIFQNKINRYILILFFIVQMLFPLRFLFMLDGLAWHRQGHYFAWRMMLHNHEPEYFQFLVELPDLKDKYFVDFSQLITYRQLMNTYNDSYFIWQLAQKLKKDAQKKYKTEKVFVYCLSNITLNQHKARALIKPNVNIANEPYYFYKKNNFINY